LWRLVRIEGLGRKVTGVGEVEVASAGGDEAEAGTEEGEAMSGGVKL
jgi:hypothetical protein